MRLRNKYPRSPNADNRVEIYAFGPEPGKQIHKMLVRILLGEEVLLTPQEQETLRKYEAGEFRRGPGDSLQHDRAAEISETLLVRY